MFGIIGQQYPETITKLPVSFRFCCKNRPADVIRSEGVGAMVIFRTPFTSEHSVKRGFQISYYSGKKALLSVLS